MSDEKMVPLAMCTCREVHYDPVKNPNGTVTARWRCVSCGVEFIRYLKPDWSELSSRMVDVERRLTTLEIASPPALRAIVDAARACLDCGALSHDGGVDVFGALRRALGALPRKHRGASEDQE